MHMINLNWSEIWFRTSAWGTFVIWIYKAAHGVSLLVCFWFKERIQAHFLQIEIGLLKP